MAKPSDRDLELQHAARIVWESRQTPERMRLDVLAIVCRLLCDGVLDDDRFGKNEAR